MAYSYGQVQQPERSCFSKVCSCAVTLGLLGGGGFLIWYFLGKPQSMAQAQDALGSALDNLNIDFGDFSNVLGNLTNNDFVNGLTHNDPFHGKSFVGDNSTNAWETDGTGLQLEVQNALDDTWQQEFQLAITDWEESDVLHLTVTPVDVDHACSVVDGLMKVCNGNFGDTGWLGINEMEITYAYQGAPGFIKNSVAKMNEYYLHNADFDQRHYTMCHEIGHGWGLPHTDENPYNENSGNCLDYTNDPAKEPNNLHPGQINFDRLDLIYSKSTKETGGGSFNSGSGSTTNGGSGGGGTSGQTQGGDGNVMSTSASGSGGNDFGNVGYGNEQGQAGNNDDNTDATTATNSNNNKHNNNGRQLRRRLTRSQAIISEYTHEDGSIVVKKAIYLHAF